MNEYLNPDHTWEVFGCQSFENYLDKFMVLPKFNKYVPEDIVKEYRTIEHLIAHAWFFYPLYDEALAKVLRTIDMAVHLKCKQLGIPTEIRQPNGKRNQIQLGHLIEKISNLESIKELQIELNVFRDLRNSIMHPKHHSYAGGVSRPAIIRSANSINSMFAPEAFFAKRKAYLNELQEQFNNIRTKAFVIEHRDHFELFHRVVITDVVPLSDKTIVALYGESVPPWRDFEEKRGYAPGRLFYLIDVACGPNFIKGFNESEQTLITLSACREPYCLSQVEKYEKYLHTFYQKEYGGELTNFRHEAAGSVAELRLAQYQFIE